MQEDYEITRATYAVVALSKSESLVIEENNQFKVSKPSLKIIDDSCRAFGSTYAGRFEGSKSLIGSSYKTPIVIFDGNNTIFFPTSSPRLKECSWISFNNIKSYRKLSTGTKIIFKNDVEYIFDVSYYVVENQIFKSAMLQSKIYHAKMSKTS